VTEKKKNIRKTNFSKADKTLKAIPLFFPAADVKVNSIRTDLLDDAGHAYLDNINKGVSQRFYNLMERHYRPNPENS
jgi:hypothetical protein